MRPILVVGHTGGIGAALLRQLHERGRPAIGRSRSTDGLDLLDEASIVRVCAELEPLSGVVVATGALGIDGVRPERAFKRLDPDVMARAFAINAIGPAMLVKHLAPKLPRDAPCFFAALSARIGSIGDNGLGGWMSYRAAKAALNQTLRCAALEMKRSHKQSVVVALHPGTIETNLTRDYARGRFTATADAAASQLLDVIEGLSPAQTGTFWDYAGKPIPW